MSSISFVNAYWLILAVPLLVLLVVPFALAVRKDNRNGHNIASAVMHIMLAILIAFTAAGTKIETVVTETEVYVVADVSFSADKNLDTVDSYVRNVSKGLPRNSKMGVVCFAKDSVLLTRPGERIESVRSAQLDVSETNIAEALEYTASLFREDVIKRIVLISDGKPSDRRDTNALKRLADNLAADGIRMDAIYVNDNLSSGEEEVQLSGAEFTKTAYLNHKETATALIQSSCETKATVSLYKNGELEDARERTLKAGTQNVRFDLDTSVSGTFEYEIRVEPDADGSPYNNSYYFTQEVSGSVGILLITGSAEDEKAVRGLYGESAEIDAYVNRSDVPFSIEDICKYDEIILANADITTLENSTMFIESVDAAVRLFGKSLLTIGDVAVQSKKAPELEKLGKLLPVEFGNNNQDPKLYTVVLDMSRSMELLGKMQRAKAAAKHLVGLLNDEDYVCIVGFYGDVQIVQAPVSVVRKDEVLKKIDEMQAYQGTLIGLGLRDAFRLMKNLPYSEKQVMLISDGLDFGSYDDKQNQPLNVVTDMRAEGIVTSVIDVGRGKDNGTNAQMAKRLLQNIALAGAAAQGKDNYYEAFDEESLDEILFGEIANEVTETLVKTPSEVKVKKRYDGVLAGIAPEDIPYVPQFMNCKESYDATTVLTVDYQKQNGSTVPVPLYAYKTRGKGKVASFTGGISESWLGSWLEQPPSSGESGEPMRTYDRFFANVLSQNTPDEKIDVPYTVVCKTEGKYTSVTIAPPSLHADATARVKISMPNGEEREDEFIFDGTAYSFQFELNGAGKYGVTVTYSYGGTDYVSDAGFTVSYTDEYNSFASFDSSVLYKIVGGSGVVSETGEITLENDEKEVGTYTFDLTVPLLTASVLLLVADIVVRKLKWNDIKSLFGKAGK